MAKQQGNEMKISLSNLGKPVIDSAAWTGRTKCIPEPPKPEPPRFQDDLARLAGQYGTGFASRVAASYNAVWNGRG